MPVPARRPPTRILLLLASGLWACGSAGSTAGSGPGPDTPGPAEDETVTLTLLQLNDVYEITPVGGGRWGGPARVATLLDSLRTEDADTYSLLAGDLFSPSALGTARVDGERLDGRQMVAVLNAMGLDYATFGNHEFDLDEASFLARLGEAEFDWFSSNAFDSNGQPFPGVPTYRILEVEEGDRRVRIGFIGATYDGIQPDYVRFTDPVASIRATVELLRDSVDVLVALTHLQVRQDVELAERIPELDLILGGHDHENLLLRRGSDLTPIAKADANVRTVWVHRLAIDPRRDQVDVESELVEIDDRIPDEPATQAVVEEWLAVGFRGFRESGFEPEAVVATVDEPLDGLEATVRNRSSRLTELAVSAMLSAIEGAEVAILNAGALRIDDVIPPGPVTQYDVIRILPFGGPVVEVEMRGDLLARVLDQGRANVGGGGYLHTAGVRWEPETGSWRISGDGIDPDGSYRVAIADFLLTGFEQGLDFLTRDTDGLDVVREGPDVRATLIDEIRRSYGGR